MTDDKKSFLNGRLHYPCSCAIRFTNTRLVDKVHMKNVLPHRKYFVARVLKLWTYRKFTKKLKIGLLKDRRKYNTHSMRYPEIAYT